MSDGIDRHALYVTVADRTVRDVPAPTIDEVLAMWPDDEDDDDHAARDDDA